MLLAAAFAVGTEEVLIHTLRYASCSSLRYGSVAAKAACDEANPGARAAAHAASGSLCPANRAAAHAAQSLIAHDVNCSSLC